MQIYVHNMTVYVDVFKSKQGRDVVQLIVCYRETKRERDDTE